MEPKQRTFSMWYAIAAMLALFAVQALLLVPRPENMSYSEFKALLRAGKVSELALYPDTIRGTLSPAGLEGILSKEKIEEIKKSGKSAPDFVTTRVEDPGLVREAARRFGSQAIVVAIDARARGPGSWEVYTHGGRKARGIDAVKWAAELAGHGAGEILLTSMDRDGTKSGFDLELTRAVSDAVSVPVIASGGVGNLQHLVDGIRIGGADAVLAASIFHYGEHTVGEAKALMASRGIPIRH